MAKIPDITSPGQPPQKAPPQAPAAPLRWYRVTSPDKRIPRTGGDYVLKMGHEISSASHDIEKIKNMGVSLTEIDPPGWWVAEQKNAVARAEKLAERGIPVPEPVRDISTLMPPPPARPAA